MLVFKVTLPINLEVYRETKQFKRGVQFMLLSYWKEILSLSDLQTLERTMELRGTLVFLGFYFHILSQEYELNSTQTKGELDSASPG